MKPFWQQPQLETWATAVRQGKVTAAPAESVYGYCVDPFNPAALEALLQRKRRSAEKGLIVLVPDVASLACICPPLEETVQAAAAAHWPCPQGAPVTLILPALDTLPPLLTGGKSTVAVRCPATPYMREYLQVWGRPLVSTSLNLAGEPPATTAAQVPVDIEALTLEKPLSGTPSRIYNPQSGVWLR